jgi:outer membrane biogenesis lipoprotein LolB
MKGRLIVKTPESNQRLSVFWRQDAANFEILLSGTLGTSIARLVSEGGVHYVDLPGKPRQFSDSPQSLLLATTGLSLPVNALLPVLNGAVIEGDFDGWQVSTHVFDDLGRPTKIDVDGYGMLIKLTVTEWL